MSRLPRMQRRHRRSASNRGAGLDATVEREKSVHDFELTTWLVIKDENDAEQ